MWNNGEREILENAAKLGLDAVTDDNRDLNVEKVLLTEILQYTTYNSGSFVDSVSFVNNRLVDLFK